MANHHVNHCKSIIQKHMSCSWAILSIFDPSPGQGFCTSFWVLHWGPGQWPFQNINGSVEKNYSFFEDKNLASGSSKILRGLKSVNIENGKRHEIAEYRRAMLLFGLVVICSHSERVVARSESVKNILSDIEDIKDVLANITFQGQKVFLCHSPPAIFVAGLQWCCSFAYRWQASLNAFYISEQTWQKII